MFYWDCKFIENKLIGWHLWLQPEFQRGAINCKEEKGALEIGWGSPGFSQAVFKAHACVTTLLRA